jgi:hypothetical protein
VGNVDNILRRWGSQLPRSSQLEAAQTRAKEAVKSLREWRFRSAPSLLKRISGVREQKAAHAQHLAGKLELYQQTYEKSRSKLEEVASRVYRREDDAFRRQFEEEGARRREELRNRHLEEYEQMRQAHRREFALEQHRRGQDRAGRAPPLLVPMSFSEASTVSSGSTRPKRPLSPLSRDFTLQPFPPLHPKFTSSPQVRVASSSVTSRPSEHPPSTKTQRAPTRAG